MARQFNSVLVVIGDEGSAAQLVDAALPRTSAAELHVLVIPGLAARSVAAAVSVSDAAGDRRETDHVADVLAILPAPVPVRIHTCGTEESPLGRILGIVADFRIECVVLEGNERRVHLGFARWLASVCGDLPELLQHRARVLNFTVVEVEPHRHQQSSSTRAVPTEGKQ